MKAAKTFTLLMSVCICMTGLVVPCSSSFADDIEAETLMQSSLAEQLAPEREVIVNHVTMPPNTTLDWHRHPGEAFHYYLEGEVVIEIEGQESINGTPGNVGHVPYRVRHRAISGEKGATLVVFRVHVEDEPLRYSDSPETEEE